MANGRRQVIYMITCSVNHTPCPSPVLCIHQYEAQGNHQPLGRPRGFGPSIKTHVGITVISIIHYQNIQTVDSGSLLLKCSEKTGGSVSTRWLQPQMETLEGVCVITFYIPTQHSPFYSDPNKNVFKKFFW